ncbi:hypothetical protein HD_0085 [[Haemophilus] ducreyi 35000HP]|uniref:Uncharacterized protein n=1 Tax=Haemophilus ducreyi (strain 35000HP / ATCC 700724) TaxID=233412 RepID=Q7VPI8_HAEDU|nr:hypothetical protein HD_0085 [[Haemophilus] ducreyi 35000HP]
MLAISRVLFIVTTLTANKKTKFRAIYKYRLQVTKPFNRQKILQIDTLSFRINQLLGLILDSTGLAKSKVHVEVR